MKGNTRKSVKKTKGKKRNTRRMLKKRGGMFGIGRAVAKAWDPNLTDKEYNERKEDAALKEINKLKKEAIFVSDQKEQFEKNFRDNNANIEGTRLDHSDPTSKAAEEQHHRSKMNHYKETINDLRRRQQWF